MPDDFAKGLLGFSAGGLAGLGLQVAYQYSDQQAWRDFSPFHHGLLGLIIAPIGAAIGQPSVVGFGLGLFVSDLKDFGKFSIGGT